MTPPRHANPLRDTLVPLALIGGDTVGLGWETLPECLNRFEKIGREKLIIFGWHTDVIKQIAEHYGEASVTLTGETNIAYQFTGVDVINQSTYRNLDN